MKNVIFKAFKPEKLNKTVSLPSIAPYSKFRTPVTLVQVLVLTGAFTFTTVKWLCYCYKVVKLKCVTNKIQLKAVNTRHFSSIKKY